MKLGWPLPKRKELLRKLPATGIKTHQIEFQNDVKSFPIHTVRLEMPKYRLENGRTQAAQEEYIEKNGKISDDFFTKDQESDAAQLAQHEILSEMIHDQKLYEYFKKGSKQTEPVVLDHNGILINGNRRVCAWRHLLESDPEKFKHFINIQAIVLPVCSEEDIDDLEALLQVKQDIKSDYPWIDQAFMFRRKLKKSDAKTLARRYDMQPKQIRANVALIDFVDDYLDGRGTPKQYSKVATDEHTFRRLYEYREKLRSEPEKQLFDQITYKLIDDPAKAGLGRVYTTIPEMQKCFPEILENLKAELPRGQRDSDDDRSSGLKSLLGGGASENVWLVKAVKAGTNTEAVLDVVIDAVESERERLKSQKEKNALLKKVREANTALKSALSLLNGKTKRAGVVEQIEGIESSLEELRIWLKDSS